MTISLLQTQFLKRYITMEPSSIPCAGPFMAVSVDVSWFTNDDGILTITPKGVMAFWSGAKKHGTKAVMGKPASSGPKNNPPTGGTPIAPTA